ncbi:CHAT domain-containing protein [Flavobacteriaceae bacterium R38]|nr:CHAT domain-containing protein [Flavobacteriaceae bacterium R38]
MKLEKKQNHQFKFHIRYLLIVLFLFPFACFSQGYRIAEKILYSKKKEQYVIKSLDSLINILEQKNYDSLPYVYDEYATWLYNINAKTKAIKYKEKALFLAKEIPINDPEFIQYFAFDLGDYYRDSGNLLKSINALKEVLQVDNTNGVAELAYLKLGELYFDLDDYYKAYDYYKQAVSLLKRNGGREGFLRDILHDLASTCFIIETEHSLKEGIQYGKTADSLANFTSTSEGNSFGIKLNLGLLYDNKKDSRDEAAALKYFNEALTTALSIKDTTKIVRSYQALGDFYDTVDPDKSIQFYKKAIALTEEKNSTKLAHLYNGLGYTYNISKEYKKSIKHRFKALNLLTKNDFSLINSINKKFLIGFENKSTLRFFLQQLAETYLDFYEEENQPQYLEKSLAFFKMTDFLIDQLKINSRDFKSRLFWRELSTNVYGKAIRAAYLQNNIEDAFYFMEKNKALLLMEDIAEEKFKRAVQLPPSITQRETQLKEELVRLKITIDSSERLPKNTIDSIEKRQVDVNLLLSDLRDSLGVSTRFNFEPQIRSLQKIQEEIKADEVRIEYHISIDDDYDIYSNKENGYALFITKNNSYLFEIPKLSTLKSQVEELLYSIKSPFNTKDDVAKYAELSNVIYNQLFPSREIQEFIKNKKVTIIPDSYLSLIPFEALSTSGNTISYLIHDSEIHYIYSNSFLKNIKKKKTSKHTFLGMAPVQFKDQELSTLSYSKTEIAQLADYYSGEMFLNKDASKKIFLEKLPHHEIVHLATHADAQDISAPWIAFNDEKITLDELYLTQNSASLVVLSGCNTTLGKQEIGEGIMSLARGFFYSGSQSVVSSLWNINDKSTAIITNEFYKNLKKGQTKSQALHNAKRSYLKTHTSPDTSPYYWAPLILLGENDVLYSSWLNINTIGLTIAILVFLCIILYFLTVRKKLH